MPAHQKANPTSQKNSTAPEHQNNPQEPLHSNPGLDSGTVQMARTTPKNLTPTNVIQLQRTINNRAVDRLLTPTVQRSPLSIHPTTPTIQRKMEWDLSRIPKESSSTIHSIIDKALEYIMSSETGRKVWQELSEADQTIQIQVCANNFSPTTFSAFGLFGKDKGEEEIKEYLNVNRELYVRWNVMDLLQLDPSNENHFIPKSGVNTQSVANALVHELGHARQLLHPEMREHTMRWRRGEHDALKTKKQGLAGKYKLLIELHNLLNHEIPFSLEKGEPFRLEYSAGSKNLNNGEEALEDLQGRSQKREVAKKHESSIEEIMNKRISKLDRETMEEEMASRDYSIPPNVNMEELESELELIEQEMLGDESPAYLDYLPKPYKASH